MAYDSLLVCWTQKARVPAMSVLVLCDVEPHTSIIP
jgi:hypothetical protein